jgi:hypothetical protein
MERLRSLIALPAVLALLGLGTGCAGGGFWKDKNYPPETTGGALSRTDSGTVVPAGGISPLANVPSSLSWLAGKGTQTLKVAPTTIAPAWRNHIDHLPDPARGGANSPGLAGQLFVFGPGDLPATLDGSITVDLFDITQSAAGHPGVHLERWKFNRDVLKALRSMDERFGPNYVLFLPWPTYRSDVSRVRLTVRYDSENGSFPIYAPESRMALDPTLAGSTETGASVVRESTSPRTLPSNMTNGSGPVGTAPAAGSAGSTPSPGLGVFRMGPRSSSRGPADSGQIGAPASRP